MTTIIQPLNIYAHSSSSNSQQQIALGSSYGFFWLPILEVIRSLKEDYLSFDVTMKGSTILTHPDRFVLKSSNGQDLNPTDLQNYYKKDILEIKDLKSAQMERRGYYNLEEAIMHWKSILNIKNPLKYWKEYQGGKQSFIDFFCIEGDKVTFEFQFHKKNNLTSKENITVHCKAFQPSRPHQEPASFSFFTFRKKKEGVRIKMIPVFLKKVLK